MPYQYADSPALQKLSDVIEDMQFSSLFDDSSLFIRPDALLSGVDFNCSFIQFGVGLNSNELQTALVGDMYQ